jgi:pimeloyl-ACP methyl ester carboxylesterase
VSPGVRVAAADDADAALEKSRAWLAEHPGDGVPAPPTPVASAGDSYVVTAGRHLHVSRLGGRGPTTTLLVHGAGAAARQLEELTRHFVSDGPVLSPDLPGHGGSDPSSAGEIFEHCVTGLLDLLAHDDAADTRVIGCGSGASVAVEVARRRGCGSRLQLLDPPCLADDERADWHHHGLPEIRPAWHGGHLQEAWHVIRDSRLFFPWFRRERAAIRRHEPRLDVASIHGEVTDLLRAGGSWQALLARALDYPLEERLRGWTGPLWIGVTPTGTFAPVAGRWATRGLAVTRVSDDPAQWPAAPT